jgi:2-polyprenyl-3-methyl-5-hydroxy-6-metoxy-1,4-benzoquinol methylase
MIRNALGHALRKIGLQISRFDEIPYGIRDAIDAYIDSHASLLTGKVLDVGSAEGSYLATKYGASANIITFDVREPADVIGSISKAPFPDATFDVVVCTEVLEHVQDIVSASKEMLRILKPGGTLLASAPFMYELHGEEYGDYWRIPRQGWEYLLRDFKSVTVTPYGKYPKRYPNMYFVEAQKSAV